MTVIAYCDGLMATDSCVADSYVHVGSATKICRSPDGAVGAASGRVGTAHRFRLWMQAGRTDPFDPRSEPGDFAALIVLPGWKVYRMDSAGHVYPAADAAFHAEGNGRDVAMGAMAAGASALEAASIAARLVPYCREPCFVEMVG